MELDNGETEVLCTSLVNTYKYRHQESESLYHYRWNEEAACKLLNSRVEPEAFSGKTAIAVKQDFFAKVFLLTLCAAYAHPIEEKVRREYEADQNRKYDQQINKTHAVATFMDMAVSIFIRKRTQYPLKVFDDLIYQTREIIRSGRSNL